MAANRENARERAAESGFVLVALFVTILPLLVVAGTVAMTMSSRSSQVSVELTEERALLAAEAGVDEAVFRAKTGTLSSGSDIVRNLGNGMAFTVKPLHLKTDGSDNDGDGDIDEDDENVFRLTVTGGYRGTVRRLAAYLGPVPLLPTIETAMTVQNTGLDIDLTGTVELSGHDQNMDGSPGGASQPGLSISSPGTTADLLATLSPSEQNKVVGDGGSPSLGVGPATDLNAIVAKAQNVANIVLTNNHYSSLDFGNGPAGEANVTFRNGDVRFDGNSRGAGILVVTGDLKLGGTFRFDGVIIVLGDVVNTAGTAEVYGGLLQGPGATKLQLKGTTDIRYSAEAIAMANANSGQFVAFNGWQEIARN